jgi:hypothetical protein
MTLIYLFLLRKYSKDKILDYLGQNILAHPTQDKYHNSRQVY